MKERPILFSGPMARAILQGQKTQTRRVVKATGPMRGADLSVCPSARLVNGMAAFDHPMGGPFTCVPLPYAPGDRLLVRETWHLCGFHDSKEQPRTEGVYRADSPDGRTCPGCGEPVAKWKPSIFMPRHASRLTLVVKSVRVERLQGITEEDAGREGMSGFEWKDPPRGGIGFPPRVKVLRLRTQQFRRLWDEINGKRAPWDSNPWVWVVSFEVAE